jgi:ABC-2 type transport system ATP-binding protein
MSALVECKGLRKRYARGGGRWQEALAGVDLVIPAGEVFGLLGPNGAGKTTLLKILLGLLRPDGGEAFLAGAPAGARAARAAVGYVPESASFPRFASPRELLQLHGRLRGGSRTEAAGEVGRVARRCGLEGILDRPWASLSKGQRQRLALAQSLLGYPAILILDEPTSGLDPLATEAFGRLLRELREEGRTILLCTHLLAQAEAVCDRVAILHHGRVVLAGSLRSLVEQPGRMVLEVGGLAEADRPRVAAALRACGGSVEAWRPASATLDALFLRTLEAAAETAPGGPR